MNVDLKYLQSSFIGGKWIAIDPPATGSFTKINPANTKDLIGPVRTSTKHVDMAIEHARGAAAAWRNTPLERRWACLKTLSDLIEKHSEVLAQSITREIGKPLWESRLEIKTVINKFVITQNEALKDVQDFSANSPNNKIKAACVYKPHGVMVVLGPFNFPLHLVMGHVIPALACGNCVILKPSDHAPLTSMLLAELFLQADFPHGVFGMVQGGADIGERFCRHPDVDGILFTGSYAVGKQIKAWNLDQPGKILALEMGGKNSSIIWDDALLPQATAAVLQSATITTGQRCTATSHLLVHENVFEEVTALLQKMAANIAVGDPTVEDTFMGPLISEAAVQRYLQANAKAKSLGGITLGPPAPLRVAQGGFFVSPELHRFDFLPGPNVFANGFFDEEIFAPVLSIFSVKTLDEVTNFIHQSQFGLAASIFSKQRSIFESFLDGCRVGVCNWNRPTTGASSALPFGGQKASGNHFPTALFAPRYCTFPVATLQEESGCSVENLNGFNMLD